MSAVANLYALTLLPPAPQSVAPDCIGLDLGSQGCNWAATPAYPNPIAGFPWANLLHRWKLDEPSGTRADDIGSLNLAATVAVGRTNGSADFKNSPTGLLKAAAFSLATPYSLSFWFYAISAANAQVLYKIGSVPDSGIYIGWTNTSTLQIYVGLNGDNFAGTITNPLNAWHHVILTVDESDQGIYYLDGTQLDAGTLDPSATDGELGVGAGPGNGISATTSPAFPGYLADLMLFDLALTATQASQLYAAGRF